jgi:hypothetical protein
MSSTPTAPARPGFDSRCRKSCFLPFLDTHLHLLAIFSASFCTYLAIVSLLEKKNCICFCTFLSANGGGKHDNVPQRCRWLDTRNDGSVRGHSGRTTYPYTTPRCNMSHCTTCPPRFATRHPRPNKSPREEIPDFRMSAYHGVGRCCRHAGLSDSGWC